MKKNLLISLISVFSVLYGTAQGYKTGVGIRGGLSNGLTVKHFINENTALEGILTTRWRGFNVTGLYEIHNKTKVNRLNWYYGAGAHIGFWNGDNVKWANDNNDYTVIGIDGILGIEYNFEALPFNLSLDWKPAINLIGHNGFWGDGGAFSLRYIF
jgi:hypothetical protein